MSYNAKNHMKQGGNEWVIDGALTFGENAVVTGLDGATVASAATESTLGGIKAATKGAGDTVEIKIDAASAKLYAPTYPVLPTAATEEDAGIVKAATKGAGDTVEIKIDSSTSKLYAPTYPVLPTAATEEDAGIVKMAANVPLLSEESPEDEVTAAEYNLLVQALIAAGVIAPAAGDGDST